MPRILFVTQHPPYPPLSGDRQRSYLLAKALSETGELGMLLVGRPDSFFPQQLDYLKKHFGLIGVLPVGNAGTRGLWKFVRPLRPGLVDRAASGLLWKSSAYRGDPAVAAAVARHARDGRYDVVVGRYLRSSLNAGLADLPRSMLDVDDLETQVYESRLASGQLSLPERLITRFHLRQLRAIVPPLLDRFDHLWFPAPHDLPRVAPLLRHASASLLPNIPFDPDPDSPLPAPPPATESKIVLVVATMSFPMNRSGVDRFVRQVWPAVHRARPGRPVPDRRRRNAGGVAGGLGGRPRRGAGRIRR